jgi:hypothetical protein
MDVVRPLDRWSLRTPLWLIEITHLGGASFLQAESSEGTWLLVFTTAGKARAMADAIGERAASYTIGRDVSVELATALCRAGARGILVDFDPSSEQAAWSRDLLAHA